MSALTVCARWGALALTVSCSALLPLVRILPPTTRTAVHRLLARSALRGIGIRLDVEGRASIGTGMLVVAGHVSWADALVLAAVVPGRFVARADLVAWPLVGGVARRAGIIPIERARLWELPGTVAQVRERLGAGETVIAFPEGTTWCGQAFGRFRPALFQAAIDADRLVLPVSIDYITASGSRTTGLSFVGDEGIGASIRRVLRSRGLRVKVVVGAPQVPGSCRGELARRCEWQVRRRVDDSTRRILAQLEGRRHESAA
ncbi:lysophospholipid acyltransferase family protein [Rhodococcus xishaensis]|uniref:lysophospholipid acyltransferase family protein n=1 Tax=Rhodococcus xishaensis TaxID=2487364 RepID=UPI001F15760B|nr:lysophospholipid acyltransferase family protein [Rhodococcus xishaensis]